MHSPRWGRWAPGGAGVLRPLRATPGPSRHLCKSVQYVGFYLQAGGHSGQSRTEAGRRNSAQEAVEATPSAQGPAWRPRRRVPAPWGGGIWPVHTKLSVKLLFTDCPTCHGCLPPTSSHQDAQHEVTCPPHWPPERQSLDLDQGLGPSLSSLSHRHPILLGSEGPSRAQPHRCPLLWNRPRVREMPELLEDRSSPEPSWDRPGRVRPYSHVMCQELWRLAGDLSPPSQPEQGRGLGCQA